MVGSNILYTSADPHICAKDHPDQSVQVQMGIYYNLILQSHKYTDGYSCRTYLEGFGFSWDSISVKPSPDLYWVCFSAYHYEWLLYCLSYLSSIHEDTTYDAVIEYCRRPPVNVIRRGFKAPYPIEPTKEVTLTSNKKYLSEKYKKQELTWKCGIPKWVVSGGDSAST